MSNILFRGKAINHDPEREYRTTYKNGDWVYGLITVLYDERFPVLPAKMTNTDGVCGIEIDYKTVGQYTGLTDKNGTKIFEGDIVNYKDENGLIEYADGEAMYVISFDTWITDYDHINNKFVEVIGNIHDNPELLKGE